MPAKKKGDKGKAKGSAKKIGSGRAQAMIDGLPLKNMSREQLEGHVVRLRNEIDREREERGFIQSELERVQRLWKVAANSLEEARTSLRLKDAEIGETEKSMLKESRGNRQQTKAVIDECETKIGDLQVKSEQTLLSLQQLHLDENSKLVKEKEALRNQLQSEKASFLTLFSNLKLSHSRELEELRCSFEGEARQAETRNDERIQKLQEELDLKRKTELTRLREEKSESIARIIASHESEIEQIKKDSSEVNNANLRLIKQLRAQLGEQRSESLQNAQQTAKEERERTALVMELNQTKKKLSESQRLLERSKSLRANLKTVESSFKIGQKENHKLKLQMEEILLDSKKIEKERNDLYSNLVSIVTDIHQRSQMKTTLLEKRLTELSNQLEKRDSVLSEVVKAANLDPKTFGVLSDKFESIVEEKNKLISGLQEEVAAMRRMYVELLDKSPSAADASRLRMS